MSRLDRPPLKLRCTNHEFIDVPGVVQTSVRVGSKWRDDLKGTIKPRIPCVDNETGKQFGTVEVVGSVFGSFKEFGYIGSMFNREERIREDPDALIEDFKKYYPGFNPESSQVTVLFVKFTPDGLPTTADVVELPVADAEVDEKVKEAA